MTRIVNFADGFTSATAPQVAGAVQENYIILNNELTGTLFTLDSSLNKTAFVNYELIRKNDLESYTQNGSLIMAFDGTSWLLTEGNFQGNSMITQEFTTDPLSLILTLDTVTGALTYSSGNMIGANYIGTFKLNIVRIS